MSINIYFHSSSFVLLFIHLLSERDMSCFQFLVSMNRISINMCVRYMSESHSVVSDSATPWTIAHQAPLSMEFSRQEYWSG